MPDDDTTDDSDDGPSPGRDRRLLRPLGAWRRVTARNRSSRSRRRALLTAAAVLVVVGGGLVGWALLRPDSTSERSSQPTTSASGQEAERRTVDETIVGFAEAYNDADCESLADYLIATAPLPGGDDCGGWDAAPRRDALRHVRDGLVDNHGEIALPEAIEVAPVTNGTTTATVHWPSDSHTETVTLRQEDGQWRLERPLDVAAYIDLVTRLVEEPEPGYELWSIRLATADEGLPDTEWNFDPRWTSEAERPPGPGFQHGIVAAYEAPTGGADLLVMLYQFADPTGAEDYGQDLASSIATNSGPARSAPVLENVRRCGDENCTTAVDTIAVKAAGSTVVGARVYVQDGEAPTVEEARSRAEAILSQQVAAAGG